MAFESLTDKLQNVFKKLRGKGRLTEEDVKIALKEVKMALLECRVNLLGLSHVKLSQIVELIRLHTIFYNIVTSDETFF